MYGIPNEIVLRGGGSGHRKTVKKNTHVAREHRKIATLDNGLRAIYEKSPSNIPLTSIQIFVRLGSAYEKDGVRGVSHLIEHLCFKGTKKLPMPVNVSEPFDRAGSYINAYTEKEMTTYVVKCHTQSTEISLSVLADMMFHSTFPRDEYTTEYNIVVEENARDTDDTDVFITEDMDKCLYKDTPYSYPVDSLEYHPPRAARKISYDDVVKYYKTYYVPQNMIVSIVSSLSFSKIKRLLRRSFGGAAVAAAAPITPPPLFAPTSGDDFSVRLYKKNLEATVVCLGFRICPTTHIDKYILNLLKFILIGSSRSRFYAILRDKYGLTYKTSVETTYYATAGDMTIYTQTNPQNLSRLLKEMVEILCDIKKYGVSTDELKTAKGYLKGLLTRHLENNDYLAEHNGKELFYGGTAQDVSYIDKYKTYYEPIRAGDIQRAAQQYLRRENGCVAICGAKLPTKNNIEKYFADL